MIPQPSYDYEVGKLVGYYRDALRRIEQHLLRIDLSAIDRAQLTAVQAEIRAIIHDLDKTAILWAEENIPRAATHGIANSLVSLELAQSFAEAETVVKFNRMNRDLVKTAVADMQDDLLQITQNVDRKVRTAIRQVTGEVIRNNYAEGINGRRTISSEILRDLRRQLGDSLNTGIIDAAGRRWKPTVFVDMAVRTKMLRTYQEATINDAVGRDVHYGMISSHGAKDACANWEGRIVKLVSDAPGDYPYIGSLPRREIFHPNCKHFVSPVRVPDRK